MRKQEDIIPAALDQAADVVAADILPSVEYQVLWDQGTLFDGKEELDEALSRARTANVNRERRVVQDCIRRQFICEKILMNIRTLELHYVYSGIPAKPRMIKNVLLDSWDETKSNLAREHNTEFVMHATFEAVDNPNESIYESFDPPPATSSLSTTDSPPPLPPPFPPMTPSKVPSFVVAFPNTAVEKKGVRRFSTVTTSDPLHGFLLIQLFEEYK